LTIAPAYETGHVSVYIGDCRLVMRELTARVDAIITDPPYDLTANKKGGSGAASVNLESPFGRSRIGTGNGPGGFMGEAWDSTGVAFERETWETAAQLLKPGGYLLAFGAPRTFHRMTVAIEDAGFIIRDTLSWLYGQGFPKSLNMAKEFDRRAGVEGEVIGTRDVGPDMRGDAYRQAEGRMIATERVPASDLARRWDGWGTALKPAWEPIVLAQKPLEGSYAANVEKYGVGALNVDGARLPMVQDGRGGGRKGSSGFVDGYAHDGFVAAQEGRWPPNVAVDAAAAAAIDAQSGQRPGGNYPKQRGESFFDAFEGRAPTEGGPRAMGDSGGASRFFYTAKADAEDRGAGNDHPTVKPSSLMRWLVTLVTPPGGLVLDPFAGSGTTLAAARDVGMKAIGIELQPEYLRLIVERCRQEAFPW
jgi:DNA modification methylase